MTRKILPYSVEKQPAKKYHQPQNNSIFQKIVITPKQAPTFAPNLYPLQKFAKKRQNNAKISTVSLTLLLSATAVFTILSVDLNVFNELMFPKLADFHTKHNIEKLAVHRQRREAAAELNKTTLSSARNSAFISHDPSMNFILQDVKEIPLDEWNEKNGVKVDDVELVKEGPKNFEKYLYPSSEYVPLGSLERIYITTGYHGLRFYKQGHQIPPGYSPELYFSSIDPLKKRGFDTFSDDKFMEMLDDENFQNFEFGDHSEKGNWKVFDPELPCLKPKDDWEDWGRSLSLVTDAPTKLGGGGGGGGNRKLTDDDIQSLEAPGGKPIGCCNGKPFSNKKRCCCRRKSYNIETDFCCARDGCANFEVFGNTGENKEACVAAGGIVVLHEKFDYSATPMLGWAKEQSEKKDTEEEIHDKYAEELEKRYENYELHGKAELKIDGVEEEKKVYKGFGDTKRRRKLAYWKRKQKNDQGEGEIDGENEINSENTDSLVMDDDFERNLDEIVIINDSDPEDFGYAKSGESSKWKKSRKYWEKQLTSWDHLRSNLPNAGEPDALQSIIFNG